MRPTGAQNSGRLLVKRRSGSGLQGVALLQCRETPKRRAEQLVTPRTEIAGMLERY